MQQAQRLFDEYAQDEEITIDRDIVDDIYSKSNGYVLKLSWYPMSQNLNCSLLFDRHPGMICLCGRAIAENFQEEANKTKNIAYKSWQDFSTNQLDGRIHSYRTFRRMIDSLFSEQATDAVDLLRSDFVGFLGDVIITDAEEQRQADFLTAEGVLLKPDMDGNRYCMASALVDSFIRRYIIPQRYPNAPRTPVPKLKGGCLDVLGILKESLNSFDKDLIQVAAERSYKRSKVLVDGYRNTEVPRESVYDTELMRILKNWLGRQKYAVTGQWHLKNDDGDVLTSSRRHVRDKYCDIVISRHGGPTLILELIATGDPKFVEDHIDKTPEYKELLSAEEAWLIHFTREDNYLEHPCWQSDDQVNEAINMVHFWHNAEFTTVRMSARWKDVDGNVQQIDDQSLTV
jgi:hypothetical protein